MQIEPKDIKEIIKKADVELVADEIQNNLPLRDQGVDSLLFMDILLAVEEAYRIKIPDGDVDSLKTLGHIANYVQKKLDGKK